MYTLHAINDHFLVINKFPDVNFHKGLAPTGLVQTIREDLALDELYPVHRLDTMTSGLLLFARNHHSAQELTSLFRNRAIEKYYIALAPGSPKKKQGMVKGDMKKGRNGQWILSQSLENPSLTRFISKGLGNGLRIYLLKPYTGRTHQLRVVMKSISVPILGDPIYGNTKKHSIDFDRGYLHSFAIRFKLFDTNFSFLIKPDKGTHFLSDECRVMIETMTEPWNFFKTTGGETPNYQNVT
jgi:tRNA pseudouridine32 synthase / 23S rRNA pseudouridine746 synthase